MPDRRLHRGPHPEDGRLFATDALPQLRSAAADLSWLLDRGYASPSSLKLVGDRYALRERQRIAVARCACSDDARGRRESTRIEPSDLAGKCLFIDGYNLLTSIEAALAGGVILFARDGTYRDMASVHGTWRKVRETVPAARLIGDFLAELRVEQVVWHLDRPVSNSGRLMTILRETAEGCGWPWEIRLVADPDSILREAEEPIATADSGVLDRCKRWVNLARTVIQQRIPAANVVDLSGAS